MDLRETETGANVVLATPFDPVAMERCREVDSLWFAGASQVAADLLTGPGRWPSQADVMIRWMAQDEDAWRS